MIESKHGYIGDAGYCPECGNGGFSLLRETIKCPKCQWKGEFKDLLKSKNEWINIKRTKLIDKICQ